MMFSGPFAQGEYFHRKLLHAENVVVKCCEMNFILYHHNFEFYERTLVKCSKNMFI